MHRVFLNNEPLEKLVLPRLTPLVYLLPEIFKLFDSKIVPF